MAQVLGKNTFPVPGRTGDLRAAFYAHTLCDQLYAQYLLSFTIHDFRLLPCVPKYIGIHLINTIELDGFVW
jgi:hypothetical protein